MICNRLIRALLPCLASALLLVILGFAHPAGAITYIFSQSISGSDIVPVTVALTDVAGGNAVDVTVSIPPGQGDLLGFFGNVAVASLIPQMTVSSSGVVTQWQFQSNAVSQVGGGNNLNPAKKWDFGLRLGCQGSAGGAITTASFRLHRTGLTVAHLTGAAQQNGWVFGVRIQSTPGSQGSAKIGMPTGWPPVGSGPPTVHLTSPANAALLSASPVAVTGDFTGTGVAVTVNGVAATLAGSSFTATVALADGPHTITAAATNADGSVSDSVNVVVDTTPPVVTITAPPDGTQTVDGSILVTGTVADTSLIASFTLNGVAVPLTAGAFSASVPLALGANAITAAATDAAGHTGSAAISVIRAVAPTITIDAPVDGLLTSLASVTVSGVVSGTAPITVTVNGVAAAISGTSFSASVPLVEGANTLTASAANAFDTTSAEVVVTLDTTPPVVTITTPADGSTTNTADVGVFGTISDASPITAVRLGTISLPPGNAFATTATLQPGPNELRIEATDAAGNVGHATSTVTRASAQPLAITIASPADGSIVSSPAVPVSGTVSDASAFVAVNGFWGSTSDGNYAAPAVYLVEGPNTLVATATRGGETVMAQVSVTYHAPPSIVITTPLDGANLREPSTDVEGVVDDLTAHVDVNGVVATVGPGGRFVARAVPLEAGENLLVARAIARFGGQTSDRVTVLLDPASAPRLALLVLDGGHRGGGDPFDSEDDGYPRLITSKNLDDFLASMRAIGRPSERFDRPIEYPIVGRAQMIAVYALTDSGADVTMSMDPLYTESTDVPRPFEEYAAEFAALPRDAAAPDRLLPTSFAPSFVQLITPFLTYEEGSAVPTGLYPLHATQDGVAVELPLWLDFAPPKIHVMSPVDESVVAASTVTITGTVSDESPIYDEIEYRVEAFGVGVFARGRVALAGGRFTIPDLPLTAGDNVIFLAAEDAGRNVGIQGLLISSDPAAPSVRLVAPADGQVMLASRALADLNFAAPSTIVSVNGVADGRSFPAGLAADVLDLGLNVGANPFSLEIATAAGTHTFAFTLFRVAAVEPIQIVAPGEAEVLATPIVEVVVRAPLGTPLVSIGGATVGPDVDGVTFRTPMTLSNGANTIRAVAYPFGQEATRTVTLDTRPPRITLVGPMSGTATLAESIDFAGVVDEFALVEVEGPGGRLVARRQFAPDLSHPLLGLTAYRWNADGAALANGANPFTVRATDRAGNASRLDVVVYREAGALRLASPADGAVTSGLAQPVRLDVLADSVIEAVFVGGRRLANLANFSAEVGLLDLGNLPLVPGVNDVRVVSHRTTTGESEVLVFALVSTSTEFATLTGVVTDQRTGEPLAGAFVTISAGGIAYIVVTDAAGRYTLPVAPGTVVSAATAPGFQSHTLFSGSVAIGETREASGALVASYTPPPPPGGGPTHVTLTGAVRSRLTDLPEPGVEIAVLGTDRTTTSDAAGRYTLAELTAGSVTLRLRKPDFIDAFFSYDDLRPPASGYPVLANLDYPIRAGNEETIAVGTTARGTVRDAFTGKALAGVAITTGSLSAVTDGAGAFTIAGLPEGQRVAIRAEIPGHDPQTLEAFVVQNATDALDYALAPRTWAKVSGTVTDAVTGDPIHLARVRVAGSSFLSAATARDGSYELAGVPEGSHAIEIEHPAYLLHAADVIAFTNGQSATLAASLTPRPRTGHLAGLVLDLATRQPIAGAVVQPASGASATSDAQGRYSLAAVPAGLTTLVITAAGYPATTRDVGIVADRETSQPNENGADFMLDAAGASVPDEVSKIVSAASGGFVETPDGRLRVDILPGSLSLDAEITVRRPTASVTTPGGVLATDPQIGADEIRVLADETEISVAPVMAGGDSPRLAGPVFVSARYRADIAASSGAAEQTAFPYLFDGSQWTALRTVPYLHAVDEVNKVVVVALLFGQTESGQIVVPYGTQRRATALARNGGEEALEGPGDLVLQTFRLLVGAARETAAPGIVPDVDVVDLAFDTTLNPTQDPAIPNGPNRINAFARPLLVFHGWDPSAIRRDVDLMRAPLEDERYGQILEDLIAGTNGVYRPMFVTYNSRMSIADSGGRIAAELNFRYPPELPGALDPFAQPGDFEKNTPHSFEGWDSFGFSMGGLVERVFQARSVRGDSLASSREPGGAVGRVQNMVTMGAPHHGAMQLLRLTTLLALGFQGLWIEEILARWSPGTMDLLDYDGTLGCELARNATLCSLNGNRRSTPNGRLSLIGGTKPDVGGVAGLGHLLVGPMSNDGVVPLSSAQGKSTVFRIPIGPLRKGERFANRFDHLNAGTENDGDQRISQFAGRDIFPFLSDHFVISRFEYLTLPECPDEDTDGVIDVEMDVQYNANQGSLTGLALVLYGKKRDGNWTILKGADPTSLDFVNPSLLDGTSRLDEPSQTRLTSQFSLADDFEKLAIRLYSLGASSPNRADAEPGPLAEQGGFTCP